MGTAALLDRSCRRGAFALGVIAMVSLCPARAFSMELELPLHGGIVMPTEGDDSLATAGPIGGLTPLLRLSRPIAIGLLLEHSRLGWRAQGPGGFAMPGASFPDDDGSFQTTLIAPTLRWYVVDVVPVYPYLQASVGFLEHQQRPDHPDCSVEDGFGARVAVGGDFGFAPWGRLGVSGALFPFAWGQGCSELGYPGRPPDPPFPGLGIALQVGLTTVWEVAKAHE